MSEQPDILKVIAQNTVAVVTALPEERKEWFNAVRHIRTQTQDRGDAPKFLLLDAVTKLLTGDSPDSLN